MRRPKKIYWVSVTDRGSLRWNQRGGGHFAQEQAALARRDRVIAAGGMATVWASELEWKQIG